MTTVSAPFSHAFFNENELISIKISLEIVPNGPINNSPGLVQIMAWRRPGDKPLSEPMVVNLLTYICVARTRWVKFTPFCHRVLLSWLDSNDPYQWKGYALCAILLVGNIVNSIITHVFFKLAGVTAMRVRTALTALVYRKVSWPPLPGFI